MSPEDLTNRALSLRALKRYEEAIEILEGVGQSYPPALSILGNTYAHAGRIDEAEDCHKRIVGFTKGSKDDKDNKAVEASLIEAYANLGGIAYKHRNDPHAAFQWYQEALKVWPKVPTDPRHKELFGMIVSPIYADVANVYWKEGNFKAARKWAIRRLEYFPECMIARRVFGLAATVQLLEDLDHSSLLREPQPNSELGKAISYLRTEFEEDDESSIVLWLAVALLMQAATPYYRLCNTRAQALDKQLEPVLMKVFLGDKELNLLFAECFRRIFSALDSILATKDNFQQSPTMEMFFPREDLSSVSFPSNGFQFVRGEDSDGPSAWTIQICSQTTQSTEAALHGFRFLELYGNALGVFMKFGHWDTIDYCFSQWLKACEEV